MKNQKETLEEKEKNINEFVSFVMENCFQQSAQKFLNDIGLKISEQSIDTNFKVSSNVAYNAYQDKRIDKDD